MSQHLSLGRWGRLIKKSFHCFFLLFQKSNHFPSQQYFFSAFSTMSVSSAVCRAIQVADGPHWENGSGVKWTTLQFTNSPADGAQARRPARWPVTKPVLSLDNSTVTHCRKHWLCASSNSTPAIIIARWRHSVWKGLSQTHSMSIHSTSTKFHCDPPTERRVYRLMAIITRSCDVITYSHTKSKNNGQRCLLSGRSVVVPPSAPGNTHTAAAA